MMDSASDHPEASTVHFQHGPVIAMVAARSIPPGKFIETLHPSTADHVQEKAPTPASSSFESYTP